MNLERVSSDVRLEEERRRNSFGEGPTGHKRDAALAPQAVALESSTHDSLYLIQSRVHTESIIETRESTKKPCPYRDLLLLLSSHYISAYRRASSPFASSYTVEFSLLSSEQPARLRSFSFVER